MDPVYLPHQLGSLHDLPDDDDAYDAVLERVVAEALDRFGDDGSLETPGAREDIGDTSLGITSLLALAWQRSRDPRLTGPARRSLDFHLRERTFRSDNPGYPNLRIRDSGEPYARYVLDDGAHPIGDWPSTVWALLQAVNVLDLEAAPCPDSPDGLTVFALRYGPAHTADDPFAPVFTRTGPDLTAATEAFTAHIGHPMGDDHGEPTLRLAEL